MPTSSVYTRTTTGFVSTVVRRVVDFDRECEALEGLHYRFSIHRRTLLERHSGGCLPGGRIAWALGRDVSRLSAFETWSFILRYFWLWAVRDVMTSLATIEATGLELGR